MRLEAGDLRLEEDPAVAVPPASSLQPPASSLQPPPVVRPAPPGAPVRAQLGNLDYGYPERIARERKAAVYRSGDAPEHGRMETTGETIEAFAIRKEAEFMQAHAAGDLTEGGVSRGAQACADAVDARIVADYVAANWPEEVPE